MGKVKTNDDYISGIREKRKQIKDYPKDKKLQEKYPDINTLYKALDTQIRGFVKTIQIEIYRASNEQDGWPENDLGYPVFPMPTKDKTGKQQVGDYWAYYKCSVSSGWIPILVERKGGAKDKKEGKTGWEDLYGTLINPERCDTFYKEIDRYYADSRFTSMVLITECSLPQYMLGTPLFNGKTRNVDHIGASPESRGGKIDSLFIRGVPVLFAGTRKLAIDRYTGLLRNWVRLNYETVLKLNVVPYDDLKYLLEKKARLEVELQALNASLARIQKQPEEVEA